MKTNEILIGLILVFTIINFFTISFMPHEDRDVRKINVSVYSSLMIFIICIAVLIRLIKGLN